MMRLLTFLAQVFINTFGITQPSEKQRRTISILLGGFLLAVIVLTAVLSAYLLHNVHAVR